MELIKNAHALYRDNGPLSLCSRLAFLATKNNSVEIAYISYTNLRYTFDKSAEKIDGRVLLPSSHVTVCDFLGFVESFFSETLHCKGQATRGAFHSTKNSGLNFRNFRMSNGTVFSTRPDRSRSIPVCAHFPPRITRQNAEGSW